jgi:hypothetical protein
MALALGAALWLAAPAAPAEPDAEAGVVAASLELAAPPGCGSSSELAQAIRSRSDRIRIGEGSNQMRRLRVEIREDDAGLVITLSLAQPNGRRSTRTLRASSCAEALDAAALVAAVSLDPSASTAAEVAARPAAVPAAAPSACPPCERGRAETPAPSRPPPHVEMSTLVAFGAISGPAPDVMPGFGAVLQVAYERDGVLSPALRLSYSHFARGDFVVAGGTADFSLDVGTLELCPVRAEAGPWRIYPCLRGTGGELRASGSETVGAVARGRPWWEVGAGVVVLVHPSRSLELGLTLAAGWPLVRDTFQFEPLEFHTVSALALTGGLGAGVRFP